METSIIIRTKNEERWLGECLRRLGEQTYRDFEIVIIDSGSTDRTLEIAQHFDTRILTIPEEDFTYPYASNFGCQNAYAEKYFVILSAHSLPIGKHWLADGLRHFSDPNVAGVYGGVFALPGSGFWEWLFFNPPLIRLFHMFKVKNIIQKIGMGVLGCTNAIIRRDLWEQHPFDERYGNGGEDTAWASYWIRKGRIFVRDFRFSVAHSHGLGLRGLIEQRKHWKSNATPQPFRRENFKYREKGR